MSQIEELLEHDDGSYLQVANEVFSNNDTESICELLTDPAESESQEGDGAADRSTQWTTVTPRQACSSATSYSQVCINVLQQTSVSRLSVSQLEFEQLLGDMGASGRLHTYLRTFGSEYELKMAPTMPSIETQWSGSTPDRSVSFQSTLVLRYVENNGRGDYNPFSIRQTLLHHRYTSTPYLSRRVCVKLSRKAQSTVLLLTGRAQNPSVLHPCTIDIILLYQAAQSWTAYLRHIAEEISKHTRTAEATRFSEEFIPRQRLEQRQILNQLQEQLLDVDLMLTSTMSSIDLFISKLNTTDGELANIHPITAAETGLDHLQVAHRAKRLTSETLAQTRILAAKARNTTNLTENLLDLENGTELRDLAAAAKRENEVLVELSQKAASDATTVKILTIATLVYLPATVVLNFFSTVLIRQTDNEGSGYSLRLAADWWIFLVVSIPLTLFTLFLWRFFVNGERNGYPRWIVTRLEQGQRSFHNLRHPPVPAVNGIYDKPGNV